MAAVCEQGVVALNTSGVNQTITLDNGALTIQALIVWGTKKTAPGTVNNNIFQIGFSDGGQAKCIASADQDGVTTANARSRWASGILLQQLDTSGGTDYVFDIVSFNTGNFIISRSVIPTTGWDFHYFVIGGVDSCDVGHMGSFLNQSGNQSITGVGIEGDAIIMLTNNAGAASNSNVDDIKLSIGWAVSPTKQGSMAFSSEDGLPGVSNCARRQQTNKCLVGIDKSGAKIGEAEFVSFDADGFTLNMTNNWPSNARLLWIVIKGGLWDAGSYESENSVIDFKKTLAIKPAGFLNMSWLASPSNTLPADDIKVIFGGASSPTRESSIMAVSQDAQSTSNTFSAQNETDIYENRLIATQAVTGLFDVKTFDNDGITFQQTNADVTTNENLILAVGQAIPSGDPPVKFMRNRINSALLAR